MEYDRTISGVKVREAGIMLALATNKLEGLWNMTLWVLLSHHK